MYMRTQEGHGAYVEVRGQLEGVGYLLLTVGRYRSCGLSLKSSGLVASVSKPGSSEPTKLHINYFKI